MGNMGVSKFGKKFSEDTGIQKLMDDMGRAVAEPGKKSMFGGGNPAVIEEVVEAYQKEMQRIVDDKDRFISAFGNYDTPQGNQHFIATLVDYINRKYDWGITAKNVAVTPGSQAGFYSLFNLLGGEMEDGSHKKIVFPLTPEYIGYADQGVDESIFASARPLVEETGDHSFKYHVDFKALNEMDDVGAVAVSRPTNPTGNMVSIEELRKLRNYAEKHQVPLIIDSAYGLPFPGVVEDTTMLDWDENIIYSMSLSKVGLPAVRSGIFIAREDIVTRLANMNAIFSLANANIGQLLVAGVLENDTLDTLCSKYIQPFYAERRKYAHKRIVESFDDSLPYMLHEYGGSYFFWMWLKELPGSTYGLYERLKEQGVIVVPGQYFFPGLEHDDWVHKKQCLRLNFARPTEEVDRGFEVMAQEVTKAYDQTAILSSNK